jgi:hypothetical protein
MAVGYEVAGPHLADRQAAMNGVDEARKPLQAALVTCRRGLPVP